MFAVAIDTDAGGNLNTLWEYNAANGGWSEISTGYFQQVSAATNASGNAVVFGVLGQGAFTGFANSLWEYSNGGWKGLAQGSLAYTPHYVTSAAPWARRRVKSPSPSRPTTNRSGNTPRPEGWSHVSPGTFKEVSAGLDASGQADAFGLVGLALWKFDNNAWIEVAGPDSPPISHNAQGLWPTFLVGGTAGLNGEVFALNVPIGDGLPITGSPGALWGFGSSGWTELSSGFFSQVSVTQTSTGADVVFGTMYDGSLWEYTNGGMTELLDGGVASTATPRVRSPRRGAGEAAEESQAAGPLVPAA